MSDLQPRLDALLATHRIPGAALGVLRGDAVEVVASGTINKRTGVDATPDTLFQIGSISKVWTASLVMMLVDDGVLDLDTPVVTYLPELRLADADVTARVTLRDLLSHRSGIGGDHFLDTGRGDDNLERYIETCTDLGQEHELGATMSYCNSGYSITGRVIEKVTGKTWDEVLRERLCTPLGLTHTNTLAEEAILFRTAVGHVKLPGEDEEQVTPTWVLPRSTGPAGLINSTAADVLTFAKLHLDDGRTATGAQLLSPASVKTMQEAQIEVPDRWALGDRWGVGWILFDWDGHPGYGHDGTTLGQRAYLRVLPEAGVAITLLTNGGDAGSAFREIFGELASELAGITTPAWPTAPAVAPELDLSIYEGRYARLNNEMEIAQEGDSLVAKLRPSGPLAELIPAAQREQRIELAAVDRGLFVGSSAQLPAGMPVVFFDWDGDRPQRLHFGARAMKRQES